jgi:hypothetical protein
LPWPIPIHIRPVVVRNEGLRAVLWQQESYSAYTNYRPDTAGFAETEKQQE